MHGYGAESKRENWIDCVKAFGIFFIVLAHAGFYIPVVSELATTFYVPIFFVLAGYLYKNREESMSAFLKRKAKRLLLPYFIYSVALFLFFFVKDCLLGGGAGTEALQPLFGILYARSYMRPTDSHVLMTVLNSPLWFLPALFVTEVFWEISYRLCRRRGRQPIILVLVSMAIGVVVHYFSPVLLPWSIDSALLFQGWLLCGYLVRRYRVLEYISRKKWIGVLLFLFAAAGRWLNGIENVSVGQFGEYLFGGILISAAACIVLMLICRRFLNGTGIFTSGLSQIGKASLHIMCAHLFCFMFLITAMNMVWNGIMGGGGIGTAAAKLFVTLAAIDIITIIRMIGEKKWKL